MWGFWQYMNNISQKKYSKEAQFPIQIIHYSKPVPEVAVTQSLTFWLLVRAGLQKVQGYPANQVQSRNRTRWLCWFSCLWLLFLRWWLRLKMSQSCLCVVSQWKPFCQLRRNVCSGSWAAVSGFSFSLFHHHWQWFPSCRLYSGNFLYPFSLIAHV